MVTPVTVVTRNAHTDSLTDDDYRDIYAELRGQYTLRQFAQMSATGYSIAWWSKYEHGEVELTRQARNELRRAVGINELPVTVGEAAGLADPDAAVYRVGTDRPNVVILAAHEAPITLHLNGSLSVIDNAPPDARVTEVTRRRARKNVSILPEIWRGLNRARQSAGLTWDEYLFSFVEVER